MVLPVADVAHPAPGVGSRPFWPGPRPLLAVLAGAVSGLAWQPYGWWPALLVGVPALTLLTRGPGRLRAAGLGYVYGLAMLAVTIGWVHVLGAWVAVLLVAFQAAFYALLGLTLHLTSRLRWWPLAAAAAWVAVEFAFSRVPFGGFGWNRIGYVAVDTPLDGFYPVVGVAGVSFLVALVAQGPAVLALTGRPPRPGSRRAAAAVLAGTLGLAGTGWLLRGFEVEPAGDRETVAVGIVQGDVPGRGIEALGRARSVTNNHLSETINLTVAARTGRVPPPDFVLWPENSTDVDPTVDPTTRATVEAAADMAGAPILVGAVMRGPGPGERQTAALWWDPERGILARYNKRNLVPFGEWIPFRDQLLPYVPLLAQVGAQSVAGTAPGVLTVPLDGRELRVGDVICFELAYDASVYDTVTSGAELLVVQSNNATYGGTGQIEQQFAITRARAMETRREIAVATTNSVSGFIDRDGRVLTRTQEFTAASTVVSMPRRRAWTPAVVLAPWLDRLLAALGLGAAVAGLVGSRGSRRRTAAGSGAVAGAIGDDGGVSAARTDPDVPSAVAAGPGRPDRG